MLQILGDTLTLALGIAVSPVPIIATILMLLSPHAQRTSLGFMLGWICGILLTVTAFTLLSSMIEQPEAGVTQPIIGAVKLVLGAALVALGIVQWRKRPAPGAPPELPQWMSAVDSITPQRAALLALALAALNPKNLLLAASAGLIIGDSAHLATAIGSVLVFVVLAACTVAGPVIAYRVAAAKLAAPLESLHAWLVQQNATIMTVLLVVMGVTVLGKGIASF